MAKLESNLKKETVYMVMRQALFDLGLREERSPPVPFSTDDAVHRTAKLAAYIAGEERLTTREKDRWRELHVMDESGNVMIDDVNSSMDWLLIAMTWQEKFERVKPATHTELKQWVRDNLMEKPS